jgi:restriction system protein
MARKRRRSRRDGEAVTGGILLAAFYAYQMAMEQPFLTSFIFGIVIASIVLAVLLIGRSRRIRRANLLAGSSLYGDYSPIEFEHVTAEIFRQLGFDAKVTPPSADEGLDVILSKDGTKIGVQCKQYKNDIGPGPIREFAGSLEGAGLDEGYFVTTSDFTIAAKQAMKKSRLKIRLLSGEKIGELRNRVEGLINTDLIPRPWWGQMVNWQKGVLIFLFYICVTLVVSTISYVALNSMIMNAR